MYFKINSTASTHIRGVIFFALPATAFSTTKEITPNEIPSEIEYMKGIAKMQMNAGIASSISLQLIFATDCIMKKPTTISAGAVAKEGIARNTGEKNSARMNSKPETIEVRPVLPPSAIPEEDSTKSSDGR